MNNKKCCKNCSHFEERTSFCRLTPPAPVVTFEDLTGKMEVKIKSMFPTIHLPSVDYCSQFDSINF